MINQRDRLPKITAKRLWKTPTKNPHPCLQSPSILTPSFYFFLVFNLSPWKNTYGVSTTIPPKALHGKKQNTRQFSAPLLKWNSQHLWTLKPFLVNPISLFTKQQSEMFNESSFLIRTLFLVMPNQDIRILVGLLQTVKLQTRMKETEETQKKRPQFPGHPCGLPL